VALAGRSLITISDLTGDEIHALLSTADRMAEAIGFGDPSTRQPAERLDRIMATCFFEPSTRTRLSFESAMLRLGGSVLGFADPRASSVAKGESLADTARTISGYADIMVIRHPRAGAAKVAADAASVPVINAGDGAHAHPTQTLTDLYCIRREKGRLDGLTIGLFGDLRFGRTVHSLGPTMARLGSEVVCIAPRELSMPQSYLREMELEMGHAPRQVEDVREVIGDLDVLYVTRIQAERFDSEEAAAAVAGSYVVDAELLAQAPEDMIVMHPLPRVDEVHPEIDDDPRAVYFDQAHGGVPVRMALIWHLLDLGGTERTEFRGFERRRSPEAKAQPGRARPEAGARPAAQATERVPAEEVGKCPNEKCITWEERFIAGFFDRLPSGVHRCAYCGAIFEDGECQ